MQPGDVPVTYADTTPLEEDFGFQAIDFASSWFEGVC